MARLARVLAVDTPFHVTQRGNARQTVFETDADRLVYLRLLQKHCDHELLSLVGYCLMPNHVHLVVIPRRPDSLPRALKHTHGRYAAYFNARHGSSGHLWQGRYYSCPLDRHHFWTALRYTELNPAQPRTAAPPPLRSCACSPSPTHGRPPNGATTWVQPGISRKPIPSAWPRTPAAL